MYQVFIMRETYDVYGLVYRNGRLLTQVRGATAEQAIQEARRAVRIARHAGF